MTNQKPSTRQLLDAVKSFQEDYTMTPAEAKALSDPNNRNRPKIKPKSLPKRPVS